MAVTKITDLAAYTSPLRTDVLPIVDVTTNTTKKVTVEDVVKNASVLRTAVSTTSGTLVDFTSIPSWAKRIRVMFDQASTNTGGAWLIQIGSSSGIETTGYLSGSVSLTTLSTSLSHSSAGFILRGTSTSLVGTVSLDLLSGDTWVSSGSLCSVNTALITSSGSKTLSGVLDRVRITTVSGSDLFDGGTINIAYEG
jgi:hypothetical protein